MRFDGVGLVFNYSSEDINIQNTMRVLSLKQWRERIKWWEGNNLNPPKYQ